MQLSGWLCINKPEGITSAQILNRLKRVFPRKTKIGHAGTLDKFACGVLPVAVGYATKTIHMIMDKKKTYTFRVLWGVQTSTDDRDGEILLTDGLIPSEEEIKAALKKIIPTKIEGGITLQQVPPTYSAIKINGQRASDRVRNGELVQMQPREVQIYDWTILHHTEVETTFQVTCSKGTYVRALARDLAIALNTVCYVTFLQRNQVGKFTLEQSILLEKEFKIDDNMATKIMSTIIPIRAVLDDIPAVSCTEAAIVLISKGKSISARLPDLDMVFAVDDSDVIATGFIKNQVFYPKNVFINGV
jgi:tRNA pseudouridine55 synthase